MCETPLRRIGQVKLRGFTLIELIIVMAIILILAGLILGTSGYVNRKGATSRAEAEIKALETACESYKADNGIYPRDSATASSTDALDSSSMYDPVATDAAKYQASSLYLYEQLSGATATPFRQATGKQYMIFKPQLLSPKDQTKPVEYLQDPFGNSYGYSTAYLKWQEDGSVQPQKGYNPTFDLWSTAGTTTSSDSAAKAKWVKNW